MNSESPRAVPTVVFVDDARWESFFQLAAILRRAGVRTVHISVGHSRWRSDRLLFDRCVSLPSPPSPEQLAEILWSEYAPTFIRQKASQSPHTQLYSCCPFRSVLACGSDGPPYLTSGMSRSHCATWGCGPLTCFSLMTPHLRKRSRNSLCQSFLNIEWALREPALNYSTR